MATQSVLWPAAAAAAPIALILGLMLGRQWSAARAGAAGLLLAWALALARFGFRAPAGQATVLARHAGVLAEGGFLALGILWILLPALALHAHQQRCGATDALRAGLARVSTQAPLQVLLLGWCLGLFLEGAAGFGTPIALVAPLLVGLGVPALTAVVLALLGHAAGVCFGALGTPVLAQAALTGVPALDIAWRSAALQAVLGGVLMVFFMRTLATAGLGRVGAGWALLATAGFLLPSLGLAAWLGPELATLGAALLSALAVVALLRVRQQHGREGMAAPGLRRALWPYAVLVLAVLATRAVPALAHTLNTVVVEWQLFGRYTGRLQPLTHPGTLLFLALLVGARLQGVPLHDLGPPLRQALGQLRPVALALLAMLCLSRLLLDAGMVQVLQQVAVAALGQAWPLLAPALGALGSFVTGSATASNVLFSSLQAQTAQALGLPVAWLLAGQSLGAAVGNIVCPHNIVAGAATVGLAGREAEVLRRTWLPCLVYLVLAGGLLMLVLRW